MPRRGSARSTDMARWSGTDRDELAAAQRGSAGSGQESVWDDPRPPKVVPDGRRVRVEVGGEIVADTVRAVRVLEMVGAPCWYLPPEDVRSDLLRPAPGTTVCEWKGVASYLDVVVGERVARRAAWAYRDPNPGYEDLRRRIAFYGGRIDAAWVDDDRVVPQPGHFYGGWITPEITGPTKGEPGTEGW
jgi:uncharacterized protein (DUF427 family)